MPEVQTVGFLSVSSPPYVRDAKRRVVGGGVLNGVDINIHIFASNVNRGTVC